MVVLAGSLLIDSCKAPGLPILQIHGTADDHVPIAGGLGQASIVKGIAFRSVADSAQMAKSGGATVDVVLVKDAPHALAGLNDGLKAQTSLNLADTIAKFISGKSR